jgi:hypothetical protein
MTLGLLRCIAYIESERFCDSIVGYDSETVRLLEISEEDQAYLYWKS